MPVGLGSVLSLFPYALHPEVAELSASAAAVPNVPSGVEIQRVSSPVRQQHNTWIFTVNSVYMLLKIYFWTTSIVVMNVLFFYSGATLPEEIK